MTTEKIEKVTRKQPKEVREIRLKFLEDAVKDQSKEKVTRAPKEIKKRTLSLSVIVKPGESGYFIAEVPLLPGCLSQGKTKQEALTNIKEAAELYLETINKPFLGIPKQYLNKIEVSF